MIKFFQTGNCSVCGLKGTGKDMLFANVVRRRKAPYISNTNYGGYWIKFQPEQLNPRNTWRDFMNDTIKRYNYPFGDGIDFYIADGGVYMPSQDQDKLCKEFPHIPVFMALSRHLGDCNVHYNVQNLNRMWDKIREQSDTYIRCIKCKVLFRKLVIQKVIIYEKYESAVNRVPPFRLRKPLLNPDRRQQWEIQRSNYEISHGSVKPAGLEPAEADSCIVKYGSVVRRLTWAVYHGEAFDQSFFVGNPRLLDHINFDQAAFLLLRVVSVLLDPLRRARRPHVLDTRSVRLA